MNDDPIIAFLLWTLQLGAEPDPDKLCRRCGLPRWQCRCRSLRLHDRAWLAEHYGLDHQDTNINHDEWSDDERSNEDCSSSLARCTP